MALQDENDRMREELNSQFLNGEDNEDDAKELVMINNGLNIQIKQLKQQIEDERKIRQHEVQRLKDEKQKTVNKYKADNREILNKDKETEQARKEVLKVKDEMSQKVAAMEREREAEARKQRSL
jgi:hypothetical protein